jgi:hypothetical protein
VAAGPEAIGQMTDLVMRWKAVSGAERAGVARRLRELGAVQIGRAGQQVEFSGRDHVSSEPIFPGDAAVIVRPGWKTRNATGEILLEKAIARPVLS